MSLAVSVCFSRTVRLMLCSIFFVPSFALAEEADAKKWKELTNNDLSAMHQLIVSAHPGALDSNNKAFASWVEQGYLEARQLSAQVKSKKDSLAVLNFYIAGFQDGHVGLSQSKQEKSSWAGFVLGMKGQSFIVKNVSKDWPVPLPPVGSEVVACDNKSVREILESDLSPYIDRRLKLHSTWLHLATQLTVDDVNYPVLGRVLPNNCLVTLPNGDQQHFTLLWRQERGELDPLLSQPQPPQTLKDLGDGRYWIHVSNFTPSAAENASLDKMLSGIKSINDAKLVVLDARGNRGGNSLVGVEILSALLGSKVVNGVGEQSRAYAMWRVSPFALSTLSHVLKSMEGDYGKSSEAYKFVSGLTGSMGLALREKKDWLRQPSSSSIDQGKLKGFNAQGFKGKLALVTDSFCASACLDFADIVLAIPGTVHLGLPTSADTQYIDIGSQSLPSGAQFWLPLKVWRDRARGNNQSYDPSFIFDGDINDTAAVQKWVLDTI
ncbi:peptidase [Pseudomonas sp. FW306-02-F02-AA]|uniref:Peptidase n=1 Tax=Pseudomonas fluorescens TaxID=294 RepID=A0A0N9WLH8_PSEFL|nr:MULTISPECIES: S41 family peptidase [Pseudomonas]ALI03465.1 peptidase [Pseudomonas fluorescens]PMZ03505.1 peptidase [Pseudomonas sp. FW306-02-F02-AB]PMZ09660.1 peptidase [Pseudomonas sp. FW306-02-H06C]PMZ15400.1 peptidase [Pseudomonas sp. FW306-02-F02-AA]PMZ21169.1 peptidase [Pseudomonas sp. FW306-02-F08-AA]